MSAQHTPGPWFTDPNDATKVLKQFRSPKVRNETIAATNRTWMTESEKIGNARLIAAAPSLYEYAASKANFGDNEALKLLEMIHGGT